MTLPTAWKHVPSSETGTPHQWWTALNDAVLNELIDQALAGNPDIKIAEIRLSEIRSTINDADLDEQAGATAQLRAAENDARVVKLEVVHALTTAYADARLAELRKNLLRQRLQLAHDLTSRLHRRLEAGLINTRVLREAEQTEIEASEAIARTHHDYQQATSRLALLSGMANIEFRLPPGDGLFATQLAIQADAPDSVIERRPDVQAAWQRLLAASTAERKNEGLPLDVRIEQADAAPASRDALYRKAVLAALQDVEAALADWRLSDKESRSRQESAEIRTAAVHDLERELAAGRISQVELLKAMLDENLAQEGALLAQRERCVAFASAQLALARD
ncbi:outer membrane efflux protein [mine drainage metagenome]|uniref:Outer membrane efflux protein n=1 Tax=mine drainage metagenome TaxID=410659 RepID=A0A1J5QC35_9ZZZZ